MNIDNEFSFFITTKFNANSSYYNLLCFNNAVRSNRIFRYRWNKL